MLVKIERLDDFGRGIAFINNKITFIENALEDEIVEVEIYVVVVIWLIFQLKMKINISKIK